MKIYRTFWLTAAFFTAFSNVPLHAQLLSESFDSGLGAWTVTGDWAVSDGVVTDSPSDHYSNNTDVALTLASPMDFSSVTHPALLITHRYATEPLYDTASIEASTDGGSSWEVLSVFSGNQLTGSTEQIDLSSFVGQASVLLRFRLQTDGSVVHDGWYIDQLQVDEIPGQAEITSIAAQGFSAVQIEWSAPVGATIDHYELYRAMTADTAPSDAILMGSVSGDSFTIIDFAIAPKNTFYYRVVAVDTNGFYSVSPDSSITLPAGMDFPFLDNGEAGATHWVAGGDWALVEEPGNPTNTCWTDSPDGPYTHSLNAPLTLTAPMNLSDATHPVLAFQHKLDLLSGDILSVEISTTDGAEWHSLLGLSNASSTTEWTQENISLAAYAGEQAVLLRFLLTTTPADNAEGCWIDNIAVAEAPSAVTSLLIDQVQSHSLRLSWNANPDTLFSHYAVYRKPGTTEVSFQDERVAVIPNQSQTQFTDTDLLLNSDYVYRVYGVSSYGTLSIDTTEQTVRTENNPLPFSDDFEGGSQGWVLNGTWGLETDGANTQLSDSPGSFYNNNQRNTDNYALTSVDLSETTWPVLSFRDKFNLLGNDFGHLQISKDGTNWSTRYAVNGERVDWATQQIDLSQWAGESNVRIRFYVYSDASTTADGWQIDDIAVAEHVSTPLDYPLYERFEVGVANWLNGGWVVSDSEAFEGTSSAQSLPIPLTPGYTDIYNSYARELNLAGSISPQITLWAKGSDDGSSQLYVQLSNNGGRNWTDISGDINAKPTEWTRFQFAVPEVFKIDGVRLRLRAYTYYNNKPTQFFVDKLSVEETPTWVTLGTPVPHLKSIDLDWSEYADDGTFQKYEVYRRETAGVTLSDTLVATLNNRTQTTFTDSGLSIGKTYYYRVYVYNLNDTTTPSNEAESTTVPLNPPINDSLDDLALWDIRGNWGIESNEADSWLTDSVDSPYSNNQRNTDNYALTAVDLSAATWPVLSFRDKFNLLGNDFGYLQISKDGTNWSTRYAVNGERVDWATQQIDLSEWAGEPNVRIRFYVYSDGSTTADGWQIDDIAVGEHVSTPQAFPLYERFEVGVVNWLNGGWVGTDSEAFEGTSSAQSLPIPLTPGYTDIYNSYARELNLAGSISPQITLWAKGSDDGSSQLYVQLSNNGGRNWTDISGDINAKPTEWTRFQFAVPEAFKVDGVRLRLRAYTYYNNKPTQFFVDKLSLEEAPTWVTMGTPVPHLKSIDLNWSEYADDGTFQKYEVYRRESTGVTLTDTLVATHSNRTQTTFTDSGLSIGKTYYYRVYIYNLNDTTTPSNQAEATTVPMNLPINDSLDDLGLWDIRGSWGIESNEAEAWLSDSVDSSYNNNLRDTNNYVLTAIDLSDATWPVLSFRDKFSFTGNDWGYLQISKDGTNWSTRYAVNGERVDWATQQIDLSQWAGESNVRIRFYVYSDGSTTADGWQIDDITVGENVSTPLDYPLYERFEVGVANWLNGGWVVTDSEAFEGTSSAQSLPIPLTPGYTDIYNSYARELNLAGSIAPQITLWAKGSDDGSSQLYVQLSNNGGRNWTDISGDINAKPTEWTRFQFAVPEVFKIDGVRLRLRAYTYYNNKPTQFFVDKLSLEEAPTWVTLGTPVPHLKSIDLDWSAFADDGTFQKYEVYRRESAGVTLSDTLVATLSNRTETTFTDSGLSIGKTYYYRVYVYNLNDTATASNEAQATTVPLMLPINDSLDDLALWDIRGNWGIESNETDAWLSDSVDSPYTNNQRDTDNYALTSVNLSDATWPVLSFRDKFNFTGNDWGYLQISKDGTNWSTRYAVNGERVDWATQQIDLSEWAGEPNVRIRVYLYTDGSTTADGWQIDDITVAEHVSTPQAFPLYERFEDGGVNWLNGGWVVTDSEAFEGSSSAQSLPIPLTPGYTNIYNSYARELNLAGSTSPQITLWAKGSDDGSSQLYVQLSNNGGRTWTDISGDINAKPTEWTRFQFAVPEAFKVDGVRLRLQAYTYYNIKPTQFFVDRLTLGELQPSPPSPLTPANDAVVNVLYPTLTVENAIDIVDDNCSYEFEVYTTASMDVASLVTRLPVQASGNGTTGWQVDVPMVDGVQYWWRSRATSSSGHVSEWSVTHTFHAVIVNHSPAIPGILSPYGGATLPDVNGSFIWTESTDPDAGDTVAHYRLEIATDATFEQVLLSASPTLDTAVGVLTLNQISGSESLTLDKAYHWRICAVDSYGLASAWATESFVYGEIPPLPPEPVNFTKMTTSGDQVYLEWTPSAQAVSVYYSPTLTPANWQPVDGAQNLQSESISITYPSTSPVGFFQIRTGN